MEFTRSELRGYDTIEQSHSGDELKIDEGNVRVWLRKQVIELTMETIKLSLKLMESGIVYLI